MGIQAAKKMLQRVPQLVEFTSKYAFATYLSTNKQVNLFVI